MKRTTDIADIQNQFQPQLWALPQATPKQAPRWQSAPTDLALAAAGFAPISLKQMDAVALLNRVDTKFVLPIGQLLQTLAVLQSDYWVLAVNGHRLNHYRTLYFDTPDFALYNLHVNDRADRYKVRSRQYLDSGDSFLEVKHKTRKDRTVKERIATGQPVTHLTRETEDWLRTVFPYDAHDLEPRLWNTFTRITLVSRQHCERVTLDLDLTFHTPAQLARLDGLAVAEVKLNLGHTGSLFLAQMRALHVQPRGFSKYCIGVSMLYDQVKKNALKPKLLWLDRMTTGEMAAAVPGVWQTAA
ncbi:MAG TPA: polyphosphate polymerase domain-containing protein [Anaerolineaceae bacterium]|nr:polyphosphate polymerase domain-containing protein [Anaerolineaceae bacterium]